MWKWNFGEQVIETRVEVGILTVKWDCTLVGEEDFPKEKSGR